MKLDEARELIRPGVVGDGGTWADFGAGGGLFTYALAQLIGSDGHVLAIDRDARALTEGEPSSSRAEAANAEIQSIQGDFTEIDAISALDGIRLDGALFANALHYTSDPTGVLGDTARLLKDDGRIIIVEYDRRRSNRWVPYPLPEERLPRIASQVGSSPPEIIGRRPSAYGGAMYAAVLTFPR